jgi:hypothetical protein
LLPVDLNGHPPENESGVQMCKHNTANTTQQTQYDETETTKLQTFEETDTQFNEARNNKNDEALMNETHHGT